MSRRELISLIVAWAMAYVWVPPGGARAGPPEEPPGGAPFRADDDYPDIYLNDSFEARQMLDTARRLSNRERWEEAARVLDRVVEKYGSKLLRVGPGRYGPVPEQVRTMISTWPAAGLAAYRREFEGTARWRFESIPDQRNTQAIYALLDRYYCTLTALEIADVIAQTALEAGAFVEAESIYGTLLQTHPDARTASQGFAGRLAIVAAFRGNADLAGKYARLTHGGPPVTIRWLGQEQKLDTVVKELLAGGGISRPPVAESHWPVFGGASARNRPAQCHVDEAASLWRLDGVAGTAPGLIMLEDRSLSHTRAKQEGRFLSLNPVVARDLVYVNNASTVRAIRMRTGEVAWTYSPFGEQGVARSDADSVAVRWHGAAFDRGRLYVVFGDDGGSPYGDRPSEAASTLVCLDTSPDRIPDGPGADRLLWRVADAGFDRAFSRHVFDATVLVEDGGVFVLARRRRSFGFEDCYLCRFDADTGALVYRTHLGGASTGGFGFRRATMSMPTLADGTLLVASNLGTVAAVNACSGQVRWLSLYRRTLGAPWGAKGTGAGAPWHYNPVLIDGTRIVCRPLDSDQLLILDAATGEIRHGVATASLHAVTTLLGIRDHVLYGVGEGPFAFDLERLELRWSSALPAEAQLYGRGLLTDDRVLVPTSTGLCRYTLTGEFTGSIPWESPEDAGNIVAMSDRFIVAGNDRVSAYARKSDVWDRLRERMAAAPDDPRPALDMCEVALRGGDAAEALDALTRAIRRAGEFTQPVEPELRRRFFDDCLTLATTLRERDAPDLDTAIRVLSYASRCAPDLRGEVAYRFSLAESYVESGRPASAVGLYQQMISDRSLRSSPATPHGEGPLTAGTVSRQQIDRLITRHGRGIYEPFERQSREWFQVGRRRQDTALLERVAELYPNAEAAPGALVESAKILRAGGRPRDAIRRLLAASRRYPDAVDGPGVMRLIADCYTDAGEFESAWCWLTKAARRYPNDTVAVQGGRVSFEAYRARLGDIRHRIEPSRPALRLPLDRDYTLQFDSPCRLLDPSSGDHPGAVWDGYYVYSDAGLRLLHAAGGEACWPAPAPCRMEPALLLATRERAVFATRHQVFALDPENGRRVWEHGRYPADLGDELADHELFASFRVHGVGRDRVVSIQDNGRVACIDLAGGRILWERDCDLRAVGAPAQSDLWVAYPASRTDGDACAVLDLETGDTLSIIEPRDDRRVERLLASFEDLIVVTTQAVRSYDPMNGDLRWEVERGSHILAETIGIDLEGLYFSDDGRHLNKISLDDGRLLWRSDRLPARFADALSLTVDHDQLLATAEKGIAALDAFDGRILWEATVPRETVLTGRWVTGSHLVAVDTPAGDRGSPRRAFLYEHRDGEGRIAAEGGVIEFEDVGDVKQVSVRDDAILLATERTIRAWSSSGDSPSQTGP